MSINDIFVKTLELLQNRATPQIHDKETEVLFDQMEAWLHAVVEGGRLYTVERTDLSIILHLNGIGTTMKITVDAKDHVIASYDGHFESVFSRRKNDTDQKAAKWHQLLGVWEGMQQRMAPFEPSPHRLFQCLEKLLQKRHSSR